MKSSCSQIFYETGFTKNFAKLTGKHLGWSHLLINLEAFTENPRAIVSRTLEHLKCTRRDDMSN